MRLRSWRWLRSPESWLSMPNGKVSEDVFCRLWLPVHGRMQRRDAALNEEKTAKRDFCADFQASGSFTFGSTVRVSWGLYKGFLVVYKALFKPYKGWLQHLPAPQQVLRKRS